MNAPNKEIFEQLEASRHRDAMDTSGMEEQQNEDDENPASDPLDTAEASGHVKIADNNDNATKGVNNSELNDDVGNNQDVFHKTMGNQGFS